jgi:hypothetical protein
MLLFMNHCNDFAPCGPSIGQYNSYSYTMGLTISLHSFISSSYCPSMNSLRRGVHISELICLKKIIGLRPKLGNTYYHINNNVDHIYQVLFLN